MALPRIPEQNDGPEDDSADQTTPLLRGSRRHTYGDPNTRYVTTTGLLPDIESSYENSEETVRRSKADVQNNGIVRDMPSSNSINYNDNGAKLASSTASNNRREMQKDGAIDHCPLAMVTIMIMVCLCGSRTFTILMNQYLFQNYELVVFGNTSVDTSSHPCADNSSNGNSTHRKLVERVQDLTSQMSLYLDMTSYGISIISTLILGTISIAISRKLLLLIPTLGYAFKLALVPVVVHWQLDVKWFYLGYGVDGICGSSVGILLGTFLYTSDLTPRNAKRTLGVTIVETTKGFVGAAFYGATGQVIQKTGYLIPSVTAAGLQIIAVIIILNLPDRKPATLEKDQRVYSPVGAIKYMFSPFHGPSDKRVRRMIQMIIAAIFLSFVAVMGYEKIEQFYLMNYPFCLDATTIGWFLFGREMGKNLVALFAVSLLYRCFPGMGLYIISCFSVVASCLMYVFAVQDWQIYIIVPVLQMGIMLGFCIGRGEASRLLGPEYQGPLFATIAVLESLSFAVGASGFLAIYKASLNFFTPLAFCVVAGLTVVVIVILIFLQRMWLRYMKEVQQKTLVVAGN